MATITPNAFSFNPTIGSVTNKIFTQLATSSTTPTSGHLLYSNRPETVKLLIDFSPVKNTSINSVRLVCKNDSGYEGVESLKITGIKRSLEEVVLVDYQVNIAYGTGIDVTIPMSLVTPVVSLAVDITFVAGNGGLGCNILSFMIDGEVSDPTSTETVSATRSFHAQTLPMNTTEKILAKKFDYRAGLLGLASDDENFGDLYVVGKDGKAYLTKSGMKSKVIWEGKLLVNQQATLSNDYSGFKQIIFIFGVDYSSYSKFGITSIVIDTNDIIQNFLSAQTFGQFRGNTGSGVLEFSFLNSTTIKVIRTTSVDSGATVYICKIIGIY